MSLIFLVSSAAIVQTLTSIQTASIDSLFTNWNSMQKPGVAIAVVRNGDEVYSKTFGMADIGSGEKVTDRTPFWIASVSK